MLPWGWKERMLDDEPRISQEDFYEAMSRVADDADLEDREPIGLRMHVHRSGEVTYRIEYMDDEDTTDGYLPPRNAA